MRNEIQRIYREDNTGRELEKIERIQNSIKSFLSNHIWTSSINLTTILWIYLKCKQTSVSDMVQFSRMSTKRYLSLYHSFPDSDPQKNSWFWDIVRHTLPPHSWVCCVCILTLIYPIQFKPRLFYNMCVCVSMCVYMCMSSGNFILGHLGLRYQIVEYWI